MGGFSSISGDETIVNADNASFDGTERGGKLTTDGQLWIGSTSSPHVKKGSITSPDASVVVGYSSPNITLTAVGVSPTTFTGDSGTANPVMNNVNIFGASVAAGTSPVSTIASVDTVTVNVQTSQAIAASNVTNIGLAAFNSAQFTVDANGFVSASGTGITTTLSGNTGVATPVSNNLNVITDNTTVKFVGSGDTLTQDFGLANLILGSDSASITSATRNAALGLTNLNPLTSGTDNTAIGYNALKSVTTASLNTAVGSLSQQTVSTGATANTSIGYSSLSQNTGSQNTALGYSSLSSNTTGQNNCGVGHGSLGNLLTGVYNIGIGPQNRNGNSFTNSESSNIVIGNNGTIGDNNTIRIGTQGSSDGQQNKCYVAGINGVTTSNSQMVTIDTTTGQLGAAAISGGTVTSVSGTANRITSTGGTTPVIDISASYVGQSSITTLGTITTGVWNGSDISLADGGTNASLTASNGGIFYSTATAGAILAGTATAGQILRSGSNAAPSWSTGTYPAGSGTDEGFPLVSDGSNNFYVKGTNGPAITRTISLTNAQIKALNGTPILAIAAPGASGLVTRVLSVIATMNYGGTNVFTAGAAQTVNLYYGTGTTNIGVVVTNAMIVASAKQIQAVNLPLMASSTTYSAANNQAVYLFNPVATEISGNAANNNTMTFYITYQTFFI